MSCEFRRSPRAETRRPGASGSGIVGSFRSAACLPYHSRGDEDPFELKRPEPARVVLSPEGATAKDQTAALERVGPGGRRPACTGKVQPVVSLRTRRRRAVVLPAYEGRPRPYRGQSALVTPHYADGRVNPKTQPQLLARPSRCRLEGRFTRPVNPSPELKRFVPWVEQNPDVAVARPRDRTMMGSKRRRSRAVGKIYRICRQATDLNPGDAWCSVDRLNVLGYECRVSGQKAVAAIGASATST